MCSSFQIPKSPALILPSGATAVASWMIAAAPLSRIALGALGANCSQNHQGQNIDTWEKPRVCF